VEDSPPRPMNPALLKHIEAIRPLGAWSYRAPATTKRKPKETFN
jgi:hypothetical protein